VSVVSQQTRADLDRVAAWYGIDFEANVHTFRAISSTCPDAFATVLRAWASEIERDARAGTSQRIRQQIADKRMAAQKAAAAAVPARAVRR